jgi:predicted ATPase/class 3 adenylate cyclase
MVSTLTDDRSFVFTDIELSSAHWHRDESAMSRVMPLHNKLVAAAFSAWDADILRGEGDSCAALFATPREALEASGEIQRQLLAATWDVELRVRIGIHSGRVYHLEGAEYGGTPLNYLGRLHKAGHGGQILVSDLTASLLRRQLPAGWELLDLGEFVLKDFPRRRIYQAAHPDLPRDFPPLNALRPIYGRRLPDSAFVGRTRELAAIRTLLRSGCTTITGPGGIGKTRLALEVAQHVRDEYRDGVCIAELAGVETEAQVAAAVANALHIDPQLEPAVDQSIVRALSSLSMLVILDNCEHVAAAAGPLAATLSSLPDIDVLTTSRTPLDAPDEHVFPLRPLDHPGDANGAVRAAGSDAVRLFVDRMQVVRPEFRLDQASTLQISEICRSLAGIPLSIELAAAATRTTPLDLLAAELRAGGVVPPTIAEGARARAAIDWSIDSLSGDEGEVLRTLAVFPGGAPAELVSALLPGEDWGRRRLLGALDALVQRSLVQLEDSATGGHFALLEPMRLTALARSGPGERAELEAGHADIISTLAVEAESRLQSDEEPDAVDELDRLFASLRSAIQRDIERDPDRAARVLFATQEFCFQRMRYEMYAWTETLRKRPDLTPATAASLLALSGLASFNRGELDSARRSCARSIELARGAGDEPSVYALFGLIAAHGLDGDFGRAQAYFTDALSWCSSSGRDYFLVNTLVLGAMSMTIQGDALTGRKLALSALEVGERIANPTSMAWALCAAADAERLVSPGAAHIHIEEALGLARSVKSRWVEGQALLNLAKLCWQSGEIEEGAVALMDALVTAEHTGNPIQGRQALRVAALLLGRLGRVEEAALLLDPTRRNLAVLPLAPDLAAGIDDLRATCVSALGEDVFDAYAGRGRRMPDRTLLPLARRALTEAVQA